MVIDSIHCAVYSFLGEHFEDLSSDSELVLKDMCVKLQSAALLGSWKVRLVSMESLKRIKKTSKNEAIQKHMASWDETVGYDPTQISFHFA